MHFAMGEAYSPVVLVVDDDEDHVMMLELGLESAGFSVLTAYSLAEASKLLASRHVDALVADLTLADGTSLELLKKAPTRPRVAIVLSGFDAPEDVAKTRAAGYDAHLVKPASFADLTRTIRDGLERTMSGVRLAKSRAPLVRGPGKRSTG
jgi:DNA-binding response OmpR family regulator